MSDREGNNGAKPKAGRMSLADIKKKGRHQLRSGKEFTSEVVSSGSLALDDLDQQPQKVGLAYDERMLEPKCSWDNHPEKPERLKRIYDRCVDLGLVERCKPLKCSPATEEELQLYHTSNYIATVQSSQSMDTPQLQQLSQKYDGVYYHNETYNASALAAGCALEAVDQVIEGKVKHAMALIRPPGHHGMAGESNGYCFFNNVVLAAKFAIQQHKLKRILIVDWDVHHGQGIQYAFYNDPRVLYFSIHRYEHGEFWPNLRQSDYDQLGEGKGRGYNINIPTNETGLTNGDYMAFFQQVLLPVAYEFNPQLVLVSAGYDAAIGDPEGRSEVTPAAYAHFTNMLKPLAGGKLAVMLEGGYCLTSLAEGAAMTLKALLDDPLPMLPDIQQPKQSTIETILQVLRVLRPYWKSLCMQRDAKEDEILPDLFQNITIPKPGVKFSQPQETYDIFGDYLVLPQDVEVELERRIQGLISETHLPSTANRTCYVYDERMKQHKPVGAIHLEHPEAPARIARIHDMMKKCGITDRCKRVQARYATKEELHSMHTAQYTEALEELLKMFDSPELSAKEVGRAEQKFNSIYLSKAAYDSASLAVGSTLNVIDEVCSGGSLNGVAVVRPPGHHAEAHTAMGFCFFNTAAIAARYAQQKWNLKRVLILDWDVHHGNGTQHLFERDPSVLYVSVHRHDHGIFFPTSDDGDYDRVGEGQGEGYNVNVPWNMYGMGDAEYMAAFHQVIMPIAYEFNPELVIVSAGFDAARGDPLGGCKISPEGYGHMTRHLMGLAGGRVVMVLEGGYNFHAISESMSTCTSVLLGDLVPPINSSLVPCKSAAKSLRNVIQTHSAYWKCLQYSVLMPSRTSTKRSLGDKVTVEEEEKARDDKALDDITTQLQQTDLLHTSDSDSDGWGCTSCHREKLEDDQEGGACGGGANEGGACGGGANEGGACGGGANEGGACGGGANEGGACGGGANEGGACGGGANEGGACGGGANEGGACGGGACGGGAEGGGGARVEVPAAFLTGDSAVSGGGGTVEMFHVEPLPWCEHVVGVAPVPSRGLCAHAECRDCHSTAENWLCLTCYQVYCGRYVNEHMVMHSFETGHKMVLSYSDLSVWCYACDSYVHCAALLPPKRAAHISKFGEDIPGCD